MSPVSVATEHKSIARCSAFHANARRLGRRTYAIPPLAMRTGGGLRRNEPSHADAEMAGVPSAQFLGHRGGPILGGARKIRREEISGPAPAALPGEPLSFPANPFNTRRGQTDRDRCRVSRRTNKHTKGGRQARGLSWRPQGNDRAMRPITSIRSRGSSTDGCWQKGLANGCPGGRHSAHSVRTVRKGDHAPTWARSAVVARPACGAGYNLYCVCLTHARTKCL